MKAHAQNIVTVYMILSGGDGVKITGIYAIQCSLPSTNMYALDTQQNTYNIQETLYFPDAGK